MRHLVGWPHRPRFLAVLAGVLVLVVVLVEVRAVSYAFTLAGLDPTWAVLVLIGCLLGSAVNIPIMSLPSDLPETEYVWLRRGAVVYAVPVGRPGRITVTVNVGGAIIPTAVSVYLLAHTGRWGAGLLAVVVVAAVVHRFAVPVSTLGIVVPMFVPVVAAAVTALLIGPPRDAGALAYVAGTLGTLLGADLGNLGSVRAMRARVVSIGGGGTFDGIFLTGVLAVLLAAIFG